MAAPSQSETGKNPSFRLKTGEVSPSRQVIVEKILAEHKLFESFHKQPYSGECCLSSLERSIAEIDGSIPIVFVGRYQILGRTMVRSDTPDKPHTYTISYTLPDGGEEEYVLDDTNTVSRFALRGRHLVSPDNQEFKQPIWTQYQTNFRYSHGKIEHHVGLDDISFGLMCIGCELRIDTGFLSVVNVPFLIVSSDRPVANPK